jgi:hypothetical protein
LSWTPWNGFALAIQFEGVAEKFWEHLQTSLLIIMQQKLRLRARAGEAVRMRIRVRTRPRASPLKGKFAMFAVDPKSRGFRAWRRSQPAFSPCY